MKLPTTRPWPVTIISWLFIIYALFSVIPKIYLIINPEAYKMALELNLAYSQIGFIQVPLSFQLVHAFVGVPVLLLSGIFMLKGQLWALGVFLFWLFGVLVLTFFVSGLSISLYGKLISTGVIVVLLTRPKSLMYFDSHHDKSEA